MRLKRQRTMQDGELTYTNETRREDGKLLRELNTIIYVSSKRQATAKRLITRGSSLYGLQPFNSNSARAIRSRSRCRESVAL